MSSFSRLFCLKQSRELVSMKHMFLKRCFSQHSSLFTSPKIVYTAPRMSHQKTSHGAWSDVETTPGMITVDKRLGLQMNPDLSVDNLLIQRACTNINTSQYKQQSSSVVSLHLNVERTNAREENYKRNVYNKVCIQHLFALDRPLLRSNESPAERWSSSRTFHSSARLDIHPVLILVIKPVAKLVSMAGGRTFRNWWKRQSAEDRAEFRQGLADKKHYFALALFSLGLAGLVHYFTHIQETPVTHRKRYASLTPDQFNKIAQFEYEQQYEAAQKNIVLTTHPAYVQIKKVVQRIVNSNQDLDFMKKQNWTIIVVDNPEENAFVLPTGHIFVYTGLLRSAETDEQLAVVLGHEIAHALLSHAAEQVSYAAVLDAVVIVALAAIWAFMPSDGVAAITHYFYNKCMEVMLHLPYSRKLEQEADEVGLQLIAKACYDVRESSVFWNAMSLRAELNNGEYVTPQWLSTHPTNYNRAQTLDELIPSALLLRDKCNCAKLPNKDPRESFEYLRKQLRAEKNNSTAIPTAQVVIRPPRFAPATMALQGVGTPVETERGPTKESEPS